jgi:hypothetical protein
MLRRQLQLRLCFSNGLESTAMNETELSLLDMEIIRRQMRATLIDLSIKREYPLSNEAADLLCLEASDLIGFNHPPTTTMLVADTLLGYRADHNQRGIIWFKNQIQSCRSHLEIRKLHQMLWQ